MTIYPDDRPYKLGTYRVFVKRKNSIENLISQTQQVEQPFRICLQTNALESIRDISDEKQIASTVLRSKFFKFGVDQTKDIEDLKVLLQISKRKELQIYLHWEPFPSPEKFQYAFGDLPKEVLQDLLPTKRKEMFEKCESYIYDKERDTIIYTENFDHLNQNVFSPVNEDKIDGLKLAQHTSWTPTKDQL